jgi:hypothetical protein
MPTKGKGEGLRRRFRPCKVFVRIVAERFPWQARGTIPTTLSSVPEAPPDPLEQRDANRVSRGKVPD